MANKTDMMKPSRVETPRKITQEEKQFLLSLTPDDLDNIDTFKKLFCTTVTRKAMFHTNDRFTLRVNEFHNIVSMETTVGRFYFNKFVLYPKIIKLIGYVNDVLTKKNISKLMNQVIDLKKEQKIEQEDVFEFYDKIKWLGFRPSRYLNSSLTDEILQPSEDVERKRAELLAKYKNAIDTNNITEFQKYEKELMEYVKADIASKKLGDSDIYESGCRGSYDNNLKVCSLGRGPIQDLTGGYKISTASLLDGIPPEELDFYADIATIAAYSRAISTREGGLTIGFITFSSPCKTKSL